jgi:hypothetical protein
MWPVCSTVVGVVAPGARALVVSDGLGSGKINFDHQLGELVAYQK